MYPSILFLIGINRFLAVKYSPSVSITVHEQFIVTLRTIITVFGMTRKEELLQDVVIKFAGDSGDGMQLTGQQFTNNTALLGIDLATFPDFPAEIRAPIGTLPGVSGFQLRFSSDMVFTPGDACDVLVAMNAAALKTNLKALKKGGKIIANTDGFDTKKE